jgi:hypothetical protein
MQLAAAARVPRRGSLAVAVTLFALFVLLGSRERPWGDARIMYEVSESMVRDHELDVRSEWPPQSHRGADGRIYSQYALGPSLVMAPTVYLREKLTEAHPAWGHLLLVVTSHLASAALAALCCVMFLGLAVRLGASLRVASVGTLLLATTTMFFVYARSPFSEMLQTTCILGLLSALLEVARTPSRRTALWFGVWAGAVVNAKAVLLLSVLGGGLLLLGLHRRDRKALARIAGWSTLGAAPLLGLFLYYNHARWGSPFTSGYAHTLDLMTENPASGLWGLLLSPGKSLFLYSPPLLAGVLALPRFARAQRTAALAIAAVGLPPLLFYANFLSWSGDYCWGPRYLMYLVPLLWLPAVVSLLPQLRRLGRVALVTLAALGLTVQLLGAAFYWDHWIRIGMAARTTWLGSPNRSGAALPVNAGGKCDSCFEDMFGHQWLPPLSPIAGHWWLARTFTRPWREAELSAPWRRYTKVATPAVETIFQQVRLDWWGYVWLRDVPASRGLGWSILLTHIALLIVGATLWWRRVRAGSAASA